MNDITAGHVGEETGHVMHASRQTRRSRMLAVLGTVAVLVYAVLSIVQTGVLNPLAAVPGAELNEIHADIAAAHETMGGWWILMTVGPVIAVAIVASVWRRPDPEPLRVATAYLVLLALGAPAHFFTSVGPGMALADTYLINGADHSPWAAPLYVVSALALFVLVVRWISGRFAKT